MRARQMLYDSTICPIPEHEKKTTTSLMQYFNHKVATSSTTIFTRWRDGKEAWRAETQLQVQLHDNDGHC